MNAIYYMLYSILLNALKFKISITILFYMDVGIPEKVEQNLRAFASYWTVYVAPQL